MFASIYFVKQLWLFNVEKLHGGVQEAAFA